MFPPLFLPINSIKRFSSAPPTLIKANDSLCLKSRDLYTANGDCVKLLEISRDLHLGVSTTRIIGSGLLRLFDFLSFAVVVVVVLFLLSSHTHITPPVIHRRASAFASFSYYILRFDVIRVCYRQTLRIGSGLFYARCSAAAAAAHAAALAFVCAAETKETTTTTTTTNERTDG